MDQKEDSFLDAIEAVEKKHKPKSKQEKTKTKKEEIISVKTIGQYKNNEIAVNVNNFLSKNIDEDAGKGKGFIWGESS
jgi:hypothetical protein